MMTIEAILLPNTDDNGFFEYFENIALQMPSVKQLGQFKACHDKQKSIIVNKNEEMWVCHFLTNIRSGEKMEYIHNVDMRTGQIKMEFLGIPDTDIYRVAMDDLWVVLGIFLSIPATTRKTEKMAGSIYSISQGRFEYEDRYHDVRSYSLGRSATIFEIVNMLSIEIRR